MCVCYCISNIEILYKNVLKIKTLFGICIGIQYNAIEYQSIIWRSDETIRDCLSW